MMEIKTLVCPRCGAALHSRPGLKKITCEFCQTEFYLDSEGAPHSAEEAGSAGTSEEVSGQAAGGQDSGQSAENTGQTTGGQASWQNAGTAGQDVTDYASQAAGREEWNGGTQQEAGAVRKGLSYWALPGFRSGKFSHAMLAILYYLFMVVGLFSGGNIMSNIALEIFLFALVTIVYEWRPLTDRIPAFTSPKRTTRITAKVVAIIVVFLICGLLISIFE